MNNNIEESREFKAAKELENALNDCGFKNSNFTAAIPTFHKTLEQNFMRLIVSSIRFMADDTNRHIDLRNKGAYETAKILNQALEEHKEDIYMPYI